VNDKSKKPVRILPIAWLNAGSNSLDSLADLFVKLRLTPNTITTIALLIGIGAGTFYYFGMPTAAMFAVILCGVFDVLDGKVAKKSNKATLFGAVYDSTLDRYSEFFIYLGIGLYFHGHWAIWLVFFTFLGSAMVSYTRARAEGLGIECKVGIMQRAERMVTIALATCIGVIFNVFDPAIIVGLGLIAVVSNFTALQRTFHVKKTESRKN